MAKPGRKLDRKQINRRQKHELDYRAKRWRCSKLAVILADTLATYSRLEPEVHLKYAQAKLRRANREARKR